MKLGLAVNNLGASQLNYELIRRVNQRVGSRATDDIVVFYEGLCRPCLPMNFAAMQLAEAYAYDGPVVATTFSTAAKLLGFPTPPKKLFLVWDLEWLRSKMRGQPWSNLQGVYGNPSLTLLARQPLARIVEEAFNRPVVPINEFDLDRIIEVAGA